MRKTTGPASRTRIENLFDREDPTIVRLARVKRRTHDFKTVPPAEEQAEIETGWEVHIRNKKSVRLKRAKAHAVLLEDRVWGFLYKLGFATLSGSGGASLLQKVGDQRSLSNQIDCVAADEEIVLCVECKSSARWRRDAHAQDWLAKFGAFREPMSTAVDETLGKKSGRQIKFVAFTSNRDLSDDDKARAAKSKIELFNENDLEYFEKLVSHLGDAARYQFLAEVLRGRDIPGLKIKVPALRSRAGGYTAYTFTASPDWLLKIGYVSHRARGAAADIDTYQRMVKGSRLKKIRTYIDEEGIFPTNIVLNFPTKKRSGTRSSASSDLDVVKEEYAGGISFEKIADAGTKDDGVVWGWLRVRAAYGSAWIIDGQHRLYAYSGHKWAKSSFLSVVAFQDLAQSKQGQMFVDINHEQKTVPRSLLEELKSRLHWDSPDLVARMEAVKSRAVQVINESFGSAFSGRILLADVKKTQLRCITLAAMTKALDTSSFYVTDARKGVHRFGPLYHGNSEAAQRRTIVVINRWFDSIRMNAGDWWDQGADRENGGLAMNDGVTVCINVLRSILVEHLGGDGELQAMGDENLAAAVAPYGDWLGKYLGSMSLVERAQFKNNLRGVQGQTWGTRTCQRDMRKSFPGFNPTGLDEYWKEREGARTGEAINRIREIEEMIQDFLIGRLKSGYPDMAGGPPHQWFKHGVPKRVSKVVQARLIENDGPAWADDPAVRPEHEFDLLHYRDVMQSDWGILKTIFAFEARGKESGTKWLVRVNRIRNESTAHGSRPGRVTDEDLDYLRGIEDELTLRLASN